MLNKASRRFFVIFATLLLTVILAGCAVIQQTGNTDSSRTDIESATGRLPDREAGQTCYNAIWLYDQTLPSDDSDLQTDDSYDNRSTEPSAWPQLTLPAGTCPAVSPSPSPGPDSSAEPTPEQKADPEATEKPAPTPAPTAKPKPTATTRPTTKPTPTSVPTATPTPSPIPTATPRPTVTPIPRPAGALTAEQWIREIFRLTNEIRKAHDLAPFASDPALDAAAAARGRELEILYEPPHYRPDGSKWYTILAEYEVSWRSAGENIMLWTAYRTTPQEVVDAWMASEGHEANILNANFTHLGVGYGLADNKEYFAQLFIGR